VSQEPGGEPYELDAELSRLFGDDRLAVHARPGAERAIVAGAGRIRRRRTVATSAGGALTAVILIGSGVVFGGALAGHSIRPADDSTLQLGSPRVAGPQLPVRPDGQVPPPRERTTTAPPAAQVPTSESPTSPPAVTATATAPETVRRAAGTLIGPDGYGKLRLGMTMSQVQAAGVTLSPSGDGDCKPYDFAGDGVPGAGSVVISPRVGVALITADSPATSPEGIGAGSAPADVFAAYPRARQGASTVVYAPAGSSGTYRFQLDPSGSRVVDVGLENVRQDCHG
jgi:hypothetical protein